jgi:hypothetical protein
MPNSKQNADKNSGSGPKLLSGGNPQIPKGEGDERVQAYIAAMPGWKRSLGERLDGLIVRTVPDVHKAVKWNQPFYGHEGEGWFLAFRCYTNYVQLQFFRGTSLDPVPPKASKHDEVRYFDIYEGRRPRRGPARLLDRTGKQPARREDVEPPATALEVAIAGRQVPRTGTTARSLTGAPESEFGATTPLSRTGPQP